MAIAVLTLPAALNWQLCNTSTASEQTTLSKLRLHTNFKNFHGSVSVTMKNLSIVFLLVLSLCVCREGAATISKGRLGRIGLFGFKPPTRNVPPVESMAANDVSTAVVARTRTESSSFTPIITAFNSAVRSIQRSPKLQEFMLSITDKVVSCGLFFLALRIASRTLSASWNELQATQVGVGGVSHAAVKAASNSSGHSYLRANTTLNSYEEDVLNSIVTPDKVGVVMDDIGGLDSVKEALTDLLQPQRLGQPPIPLSMLGAPTRSVLLYGPPGCGT
jgi:hypothetical protein